MKKIPIVNQRFTSKNRIKRKKYLSGIKKALPLQSGFQETREAKAIGDEMLRFFLGLEQAEL
jgi:hypothetical protein